MSTTAIELDSVSKRYFLGGRRLGGYMTLREVLAARLSFAAKPEPLDEVWALRDVEFALEQGGALGIVGHNGAGKSTLLKVLARITQPTNGVSRTRGRVGTLLDVGTGFHPELNGRENVYLNGAILGMTRREITRRFDAIVEFAGLERFLDTPLKRYSWGMWLRLAFAVAAHVEPEIMLVDEVLAVGDVRFRDKCLGKMSELGVEGRTVVFVSHDLGAIARLCPRTLWLANGEIQLDGPSGDVIEQYVRSVAARSGSVEFASDPGRRVQLVSVSIVDAAGDVIDSPNRDEALVVSVRFSVQAPVPGLDVSISLLNHQGVQVVEEDWGIDTGGSLAPTRFPQEYEARLTIPPVLTAGDYFAGIWIGSSYETVLYEPQALAFRLWPRADDRSHALERNRLVQPGAEWDVCPVDPIVETGAVRGDGLGR